MIQNILNLKTKPELMLYTITKLVTDNYLAQNKCSLNTLRSFILFAELFFVVTMFFSLE